MNYIDILPDYYDGRRLSEDYLGGFPKEIEFKIEGSEEFLFKGRLNKREQRYEIGICQHKGIKSDKIHYSSSIHVMMCAENFVQRVWKQIK